VVAVRDSPIKFTNEMNYAELQVVVQIQMQEYAIGSFEYRSNIAARSNTSNYDKIVPPTFALVVSMHMHSSKINLNSSRT